MLCPYSDGTDTCTTVTSLNLGTTYCTIIKVYKHTAFTTLRIPLFSDYFLAIILTLDPRMGVPGYYIV